MAERAKLIEKLDSLMRLARDIRIALDFRSRLDETDGVVDLLVFGDGQSVFTRLSTADLAAVDARVSKMVGDLVAKADQLKELATS